MNPSRSYKQLAEMHKKKKEEEREKKRAESPSKKMDPEEREKLKARQEASLSRLMRPTTSVTAKRNSGRSTEGGAETAREVTSSVVYQTTTSSAEQDNQKKHGRESMASTTEIETIPEYKTTGYQTTRVYEQKRGAPLQSKSETKTTVRRGPGGRTTTTTTTTTNRTVVKDGGKE